MATYDMQRGGDLFKRWQEASNAEAAIAQKIADYSKSTATPDPAVVALLHAEVLAAHTHAMDLLAELEQYKLAD